VIYEAVSDALVYMRTCPAPMGAAWKDAIDEDFKGRK